MTRDEFEKMQKYAAMMQDAPAEHVTESRLNLPGSRSRMDASKARMSDTSLSPEEREAAKRNYQIGLASKQRKMQKRLAQNKAKRKMFHKNKIMNRSTSSDKPGGM